MAINFGGGVGGGGLGVLNQTQSEDKSATSNNLLAHSLNALKP